jgi:RIO kinase 1
MRNNLDLLLADGIIDEVLGRLQSGKEADVFRVRYRGEVVAAKVYKDREQRSFKHNASYKEGRKVRNSRTQRAMDKGSRFGRDEAEDAWKSSEATTLQLLHGHGVRVPTPVLFYDGVLLMQLVTDAHGDDAPRLIDAPIDPAHAGALYRDVRRQIVGMLCCDLIHGDLSPYNVLLGAAGPTLIDFPQTLSAAHNSQSERFFHRDFDNILRFFGSLDRRLHACGGDAREIWRTYTRRELTPDFMPSAAAREPRFAPPPPRPHVTMGAPAPKPPLATEGDRRPYAPRPQAPPRAPGYGPPARPPAPRPPPQAPRGPVVVYVKRTGTRSAVPHPEVAPVQPSQPQASLPESGDGRRERGRRR